MDDPRLDPTLYVRAPQLDVPTAVALGTKLVAGVPRKAPAGVKTAARYLRHCTTTLQDAWQVRARTPRPEVVRPIDIRVDNSWAALDGRLEYRAMLPDDEFPGAARAAELRGTLYPNGRDFLGLEFHAQWAECDTRLKRIDAENLAADLDALAGPEFLAHIRAMHVLYGDALGIRTPSGAVVAPPNLAQPLRNVSEAVSAYALQLLAMDNPADRSAAARAQRDVIRQALRPIDEVRAKASRTTSATADEPTPPDDPTKPSPT